MNWKGYSMKKIPSDLTPNDFDLTIAISFKDGIISSVRIPIAELDKETLDAPLGACITELLIESGDMYTPWKEPFEDVEQEDIYYGGLQ